MYTYIAVRVHVKDVVDYLLQGDVESLDCRPAAYRCQTDFFLIHVFLLYFGLFSHAFLHLLHTLSLTIAHVLGSHQDVLQVNGHVGDAVPPSRHEHLPEQFFIVAAPDWEGPDMKGPALN